jgi:hypothetical protein
MSPASRFDEEMGLIESKMVEKQLFLDHLVQKQQVEELLVVVWAISDL